MICSKCNTNNPEGSMFCNKCGTKLQTDGYLTETKEVEHKKNDVLKRLHIKYIIAIAGVLVMTVIGISLISNPLNKFKRTLNNKNYVQAMTVYNEDIKGNTDREKSVAEYLKEQTEKIKNDFINSKLEYNLAITQLDTIENTGLIPQNVYSTKNEINALNGSRVAYKAGIDFIKNKNYKDGIVQLKKVIQTDKNYAKAQETINSSIIDYKASILNEVEKLALDKEYDRLLSLLNESLLILPDDPDFKAKQTNYTSIYEDIKAAERKAKIEGLIKNQEMTVEKISTYTDWLDDVNISVVVKNNTKKVVKKFVVSWMGFDAAGYPVKTGWLSPDFVESGNAEHNIQPGQTFGSGYGWALTGGFDKEVNAKKWRACVKEVEYYDGTTWTNPYYELWIEEYAEKPYH